jgi:hypothetical protein
VIVLSWLLAAVKWWLISTVVLYVLFWAVVSLQNFVRGKARWVFVATLLASWPVVLVGVLSDIAYQITWGTLLFRELPAYDKSKGWRDRIEWMLTWRLQRHKRSGYAAGGWRFRLAVFLCTHLVEKVQAKHCD